MASDLINIVSRNQYYKDSMHRLFLVFLVSLFLNVSGIYAVYYLYTHPPAPVYFPTSINGRISPLIPLDKPNMSDAEIKQWANSAIIASYTYNFVSYRSDLQASSEFFTPEGWNTYLNALKSSNNLDAVRQNKFVVTAEATQAPTIVEQGIYSNGRYSWRIQMPVMVYYQSSTAYSSSPFLVTMLIERVSTLNSSSGIGIASIVSETVDGTGQS